MFYSLVLESPVSRAEVTKRVDDCSMNHRGGQPTVAEVVQGSAGENLNIIDNFDMRVDMMNYDSGDEDLVNISRDDDIIRLQVTSLGRPALDC